MSFRPARAAFPFAAPITTHPVVPIRAGSRPGRRLPDLAAETRPERLPDTLMTEGYVRDVTGAGPRLMTGASAT